MAFNKDRADRVREDITRGRHRQERELPHSRIAEERLIAGDKQGLAESRQLEERARERKEEAKLRGKEFGRQRALLHREERERQEKEREREGERERSRQEQRARKRAGSVHQAWDRTRESQELAGRRSCESTSATADDEKHIGDGKKSRRRSAYEKDATIAGESREARTGRRDARDKRKRSASADSEEVYGHGKGRGDGGGEADLDELLTARGESALPRCKSGRGDRETRVSDKNRDRSRKSERKERRRREFRDHKGRTDISSRASEVPWRESYGSQSSAGDGGRWQPSPSPGAIGSRQSVRTSHAPNRWPSSTQIPLSVWEPNRRADSRRPPRATPAPGTLFSSRPLLQHGATGTLLLPLVARGMGSGTLDLGARSSVSGRTGGGMGTLSVL